MISCLISAYYCADFMHIRMENLEGFERIVVCESGSEEEEIARQYGAEKVIATLGVPSIGKAWNYALESANGEYVTTANTDDYIYPDGYERMAAVMDAHPDVGLVFSMVSKTSGGQPQPWKRIPESTGIIDGSVILDKCIVGPMPLWRNTWKYKIGMFDEDMVSADWDYWMRMYIAGGQFYYIDEPLGIYAKRDDSLEHRNGIKIAQEAIYLREKYRVYV